MKESDSINIYSAQIIRVKLTYREYILNKAIGLSICN